MSIGQLYELFLQYPSIQTDTRKLKKGDLFFALKGPNFNGNAFAEQALEQGAAYAVIDEPVNDALSGRLILVPDVLSTLQALSLHHRRQFDIPFIAITGSNGKTTTKELVYAVLAAAFTVYTTQGNLNNHIGVPLTLLSVKKDAQFAVIEMGANHQREIAGYCEYARPTHGIITNAGLAHLEGFGGAEGVKKGKGELYDFLRQTGGAAFVMWDYDYLREMSKGIPEIITYGSANADYTGTAERGAGQGADGAGRNDPFLTVNMTHGASTGLIHTQLVGDYNLPNVLVAVAVGKHFGVPDEKIRQAIEQYAPSNSRSQLIQKDGNQFILDAYNANPSSMRAAIENFARMPEGGKVLVLGAMAELGPGSVGEHRRIIDLIRQYPWKEVALVGGDFLKTDHPWQRFENARQAGQWLKGLDLKNAYILIKGSRSMRMEEVLS
ncbi:MAG: UDP-N-acetylmuramoyl-tripeptide--D-alanyl-D-alanine ligase [Bacteroidota bacterium]|nr:UDP-N-acetylmuramoyl-tripeptide--D-alanyl-D-alanine ligase [Bacteroidota bacterium]MDP4259825.1 UDP-N-acetylmuramoyl-tripeptide--D-alanyl-D-alanine ligase [Bacteroidota bacterium]